MRKVVARQEEYVKIEMVCQDINVYWQNKPDALKNRTDKDIYLNSKFEYTNNKNEAKYTIEYDVSGNPQKLIIQSITNAEGKVLVENLEFPLKEGN